MDNNFVKISSAAYKILDFLPDGDILKNKAKEKVLAILENLTVISGTEGWISLKKEVATTQLLEDIEVLNNYLKIIRQQGWIDAINFLILTKEYDQIKSNINLPNGLIRSRLQSNRGSSIESGQNLEFIPKPESKVLSPVNKKESPVIINEEYSERQKKILQILSGKEKVQVRDLIKEIPNITKRTIRRDLDDLLKKGKISRIGEWNQVFYQLSHQ